MVKVEVRADPDYRLDEESEEESTESDSSDSQVYMDIDSARFQSQKNRRKPRRSSRISRKTRSLRN